MSITKSPWIIHYDGSSCNGCDIEVLACLTPMYDLERFGIINTGNPKHADIFLVTGAVNEQNIPVVKQIYDQMPSPKVVIAIGVCASSGGIFRDCYNIVGGVDQVIPVDVYVPGCAARPEAIIDGVVKGLGVLAEKQVALTRGIPEEQVLGGYIYDGAHDESGTLIPEYDADADGLGDSEAPDGTEAFGLPAEGDPDADVAAEGDPDADATDADAAAEGDPAADAAEEGDAAAAESDGGAEGSPDAAAAEDAAAAAAEGEGDAEKTDADRKKASIEEAIGEAIETIEEVSEKGKEADKE